MPEVALIVFGRVHKSRGASRYRSISQPEARGKTGESSRRFPIPGLECASPLSIPLPPVLRDG
jgi:hypothetical protein